MPPPVRAEATLTLPHAPDQLWPFIADTDRMDRTVGLPAATFTRARQAAGGETITGEYRLLGRTLARWYSRRIA